MSAAPTPAWQPEFYLDETGLEIADADPDPATRGEALETALRGLVALLEQLRDDDMRRLKHQDVYWANVLPGLTLYDLLYPSGARTPEQAALDPDILAAVRKQIDALSEWDAEAGWEQRDGAMLTSRDRVAEKLMMRLPEPAALIVVSGHEEAIPEGRAGVSAGADERRPAVPFRVGSDRTLTAFYRSLPDLLDSDAEEFLSIARVAYRRLAFKPGIAREFDQFEEPYRSIRPKVAQALAGLNDHLLDIVRDCKGDHACIEEGFKGAAGYGISRERGRTHHNKAAMREREITIDGRQLVCEWHLKIKRHIDRIHFHFGQPEPHKDRVIIGIFTSHLAL